MSENEPAHSVKLLEFVREVIRQRRLLIDANERDERALKLLQEDRLGRRNREVGKGHRRIWTSRDARFLKKREDGSIPQSRTIRLLEKYYPVDRPSPYFGLVNAAIEEAMQLRRSKPLLDALGKLASAHRYVMRAFKATATETEHIMPPGDADSFHDDCLRQLAVVAPEINEFL